MLFGSSNEDARQSWTLSMERQRDFDSIKTL